MTTPLSLPGLDPPRRNGELAFDAPWQSTVFALAAAVIEHAFGGDREPFRQQITAFRAAFPDLHVSIDDLLIDGDRFASRTTVTGTHAGDLMGIPATGKHISVEAVDIGRIQNGQAQERWGGLDMYSLLTQLGMIPAPQPS